MADDEGANQAVKELNGQVVDGQEIKVDNAHSNSGGGGGRGGDRRGGRGGGEFHEISLLNSNINYGLHFDFSRGTRNL